MKISNIMEQIRTVEGFDVQLLDADVQRPFNAKKKVDFSYDYKRAAPSKLTVSQWVRQRVPEGVNAKVYNSDGNEVHGRTTLNTVRRSYE